MIAHYRNDSTGELSAPHRIGTDDQGRALYLGVPGWSPVDGTGNPVEVDTDEDGNFVEGE